MNQIVTAYRSKRAIYFGEPPNQPDVLLLDMTMPNYDVSDEEAGGRERRYAGREILRQIKRRGYRIHVIVVTQYEQFEEDGQQVPLSELTATLHKAYSDCFVGAVFYQAADISWMTELRKHLLKLENAGDEYSLFDRG
jgi:CheY-like chemotaxis protein